jgi:hypothetical protein
LLGLASGLRLSEERVLLLGGQGGTDVVVDHWNCSFEIARFTPLVDLGDREGRAHETSVCRWRVIGRVMTA